LTPIYLDHSASGLPDPAILDYYHQQIGLVMANPASLHRLGLQASRLIKESRTRLATSLHCRPDEILFTSGGTESINTAIKGYMGHNPKRGRTILCPAGEHSATRQILAYMENQGYKARQIPLESDGTMNLAKLAAAIDSDTAMITGLLVHNETGSVNPIRDLVRLRDQINPRTAIHLDAVQAIGKLPIRFDQMGIDLLSASGHKFGAPKGSGFLLIRKGTLIEPLIHGGGQQHGLRGGTENAPLCAAMALALEQATLKLDTTIEHCRHLAKTLLDSLDRRQVAYQRLSPDCAIPQILNLSFPGLRGETLQHALEAEEIYLSTGSACSSSQRGPSRALLAMGISRTVAECSIRVSLSVTNTSEEMQQTAAAIDQACQLYRRERQS
jgi:cysteine desulfurase